MSRERSQSLEKFIEIDRRRYEANSSVFYKEYNTIKSPEFQEFSHANQAMFVQSAIDMGSLSVRQLIGLRRKLFMYLRRFNRRNECTKAEATPEELDVSLASNVLDAERKDIRGKNDELRELLGPITLKIRALYEDSADQMGDAPK